MLGVGKPALEVEPFPDCGCDACDSGSRDLLEDLDRTILDGSVETVLSPGWTGAPRSARAAAAARGRTARSRSPRSPGPTSGCRAR